jgi:hypothetical protein
VFDVMALTEHQRFAEHRSQTFNMILDATLKLAREICLPTLEEMDNEPPVMENGIVKVHPAVRRFMHECGQGG